MTAFDDDCRLVKELLLAWQPWAELRAMLGDRTRPTLIVGEGSSALFPGGFAQELARRFGLPGRVDVVGGREAAGTPLTLVNVVLMSNSGRTRELVELMPQLTSHPHTLALLGVGDGPLAAMNARHRVLLSRPEIAIAATASVFMQALALADAVAHAGGRVTPMAQIIAAIQTIFSQPLPASALTGLAQVRRVSFAGNSSAAELSLKVMEVAGLPGMHLPGTLLLHGIEEVYDAGDLVVVLEPHASDVSAIRERIARATGARVLIFSSAAHGDWRLPELGDWAPFAHLVAGWRLLAAIAQARGHNPDVPRRARKIGNPALNV